MRVLSSLAIKQPYLELLPQFQKQSGHAVETEWLGVVDILKRVKAGDTPDLVIGWRGAIEELEALGKVSEIVDLARSWVAVAVKSGAKRPDLGSAESLKRELRAARSAAYSSGPSGMHLKQLFARWGLDQEMQGRLTQTPPGTAVGPLVARGEAEIGFQQMSELLPVAGIDIVGPLPAEIQVVTTFSGGLHAAAKAPDAARAWMAFIAGAPSAAVLRKCGMEPARQ